MESPDVASFSIKLTSLNDVGRLDRVDSGRALSSTGIFDPPTHALASCLPPIQGSRNTGPSTACFFDELVLMPPQVQCYVIPKRSTLPYFNVKLARFQYFELIVFNIKE